jgi:hypothetical protein
MSKKFDLGGRIRVSPPIWPGSTLEIQPGDLSKFTPLGNGVYGYQDRGGSNPFTSAPLQEATAGIVYFDNNVLIDDFASLTRVMGMVSSKKFAVFTDESNQPFEDGYLAQMRVVSRFGLSLMFNALTKAEYEKFAEQQVSIFEAFWLFIVHEKERWGSSWFEERGLEGKFGGDGNIAREQLAFGFMVENSYYHVYRMWSRAWLVTK